MKIKHVVMGVAGVAAAYGAWRWWTARQMVANGAPTVTLVGGVPTTVPKDAAIKNNAARFPGRPDIAARREASAQAASEQSKFTGTIKGAADRNNARMSGLLNNLADSSATSKATTKAGSTKAAEAVSSQRAADKAVANLVTKASRVRAPW